MRTGVIIIGGSPPPPEMVSVIPPDAFVVAADSGFDHALMLGVRVDVLVGDLDSVSATGLTHATAAGIRIDRHPAAKDATDAELAIDAALAAGCRRLIGISGVGDRLDHLLGTIFSFAAVRDDVISVTLWVDTTRIDVVTATSPVALDVPPGNLFSLLPLHGPVEGVTITDAQYPLDGATLTAGSCRGMSNVATAGRTTVSIGAGRALVIVPDASKDRS